MKPVYFEQSSRLFLSLLFSVLFCSTLSAVVYSKQSGAWTSPSTWQGGQVPAYNDYIVIQAGHTVTNGNPFTQNGFVEVKGTLVLTGNAVRIFSTSSSLDIDGLLRIEGGTNHFDCVTYGAGTLRQTVGSSYFEKYHVNTTDLQGGAAYFYGPLAIDFPKLLLKNATLDGSEDLEVSESMSWGNNGVVDQGTKLILKAGAILDFVAGGTWKNSGHIYNYGTVNCPNGTLKNHNSKGNIGNNGQWNFLAQAGKTTTFDFQHFINNEQSIKEGGGTVTFPANAEFYSSSTGSLLHLKGGTFNLKESGSLGLQGLWQIDAGATLNYTPGTLGNYVYFAGPKIINNGQIKGTTCRFAGGDDMILEGNGKIEHMEILKTGGANVLLAGSPEVTQQFTLTSGRIVLNQYDLRLGTATVSYSSDITSYIETNGTGSCVRTCAPGGYFLFPVGRNDFAPFFVNLKPSSTQDFVKVRVTDSFYGEYNGNNPACSEEVPVGVVGRNWIVAEQIPGGTLADVVAYWLPAAERTGFDPSNCTLGRYLGNNWEPSIYQPATDAAPFSRIHSLNLSSFGLFGVFDAGHEPDVNFISPAPAANTPICEWQDLQLQANTSPHADVQWNGPNGFQSIEQNPIVPGIQLSQEGVYTALASQYGCPAKQGSVNVLVNAEPNASVLGPNQIQAGETAALLAQGGVSFVWSTGETTQAILVSPTQITDYVVTVTNPAGCTASVVHTVQVSGTSATQDAIEMVKQMKIAPNPTSDETILTFESATSGDAQLRLTDSRGVQLFHQHIAINSGPNQTNISLANLPAGTYQATLVRENEVKTIRVIKLRG